MQRQPHDKRPCSTPLGSKRSDLVLFVAPLCIKGLRLVTVQLPEKFLGRRTAAIVPLPSTRTRGRLRAGEVFHSVVSGAPGSGLCRHKLLSAPSSCSPPPFSVRCACGVVGSPRDVASPGAQSGAKLSKGTGSYRPRVDLNERSARCLRTVW